MSNNLLEQKSFSENLLDVSSFYEENKTLTKLLEENFETLEKQISQHKCVKNVSKLKKQELQIEESFYVNLAKILKNSKEFYGQEINPSTLASIMSRIREKRGLTKFSRLDKKIETQTPLQAVVSTQVAVTQQQPANNRPQKKNEDESSSVGDKKIDKGFESQPVSRVGNLSTGQVSQAQYKELIEFLESFETLGQLKEPLTKLVQVNRTDSYRKQWTQEDEDMAQHYVKVIQLAKIDLNNWQKIKTFKFEDLDIERFQSKWGTYRKDFEKSVFLDYMKKYFEFHN